MIELRLVSHIYASRESYRQGCVDRYLLLIYYKHG